MLKLETHLAFSNVTTWCASRIFVNDLYLTMKISELHNFAYDNTIASAEDTIKDLIEKLEAEAKQLQVGSKTMK